MLFNLEAIILKIIYQAIIKKQPSKAQNCLKHMFKLRRQLSKWRGVIAIAPTVAGLVIAATSAGLFQLLEWATLDLFFRLRPQQPMDSRIVIVTISESDIANVGKWPMSDATLAKLIANIKARQPSAIGLDLYRDLPVEPGHQTLMELFKSTPNLIGVEKVAGDRVQAPPILKELDRVGLSDLVLDEDGKVRRGLLSVRTEEGTTKLSLPAKLALMYLGDRDISLEILDDSQMKLGLGKAVFTPFKSNDGAYVRADAGGYQILLNFRGYTDKFQTISLTKVLENKIPPQLIEGRIVLIGATAESLNDFFFTSFSPRTPGVVIHANLLSQILSGAIENRHFIRVLPQQIEWLWVLIWSFNGAWLTWILLEINPSINDIFLRWMAMIIGILFAASSLFISSYFAFLGSWWVPVVSPLFACIASAITTTAYHSWKLHLASEKKLSQFLEAVPVGVAVLDNNGRLYYSNKKAEELFERGAKKLASIDNLSDIYQIYIAGTDRLYPSEKLPIVMALKGEPIVADDLEIILKDRTIPLESMGTPVKDEDGNIVYAIATFQDITDRRKIEAERENYTQELYELNRDLEKSLDTEFKLTEACERFVPHEFLSFLGYESLVDVKLGDAVEQEMSILFSDIRNFTSTSETMSSVDNFQFINAYLKRMEPAIENNNGFIDKYIGDAIMALFGGKADDAVKAGISMLKLLAEYNTTRQRPGRLPISIGIGINTGSLMLGIVGGANRISGTVISDAVNLASRIESLTKFYGVSLLISHYTFFNLEQPINYAIRFIDRVKVKGKSEMVSIFEVFDADPEKIKEGKLVTRTLFERGVMLYNLEDFKAAALLFKDCLKITPWDKVVDIYWQRCQEKQRRRS